MSDYGFDLRRRNQQNRKKRRTGGFVIAFGCFVIVLATVSFLWFWRSLNYDFNNIFANGDTTTPVVETVAPVENGEYNGVYTFLIAVTSDDGKESYVFNAITVDLSDETIRVVPIDGSIVDSETGLTCHELLVTGGIKSVVSFLSEHYGVPIVKYVVLTETDYKSVFRAMGDVTITISEDVIYETDDMYLEITADTQTQLSSDKVYKYMKYIYETKNGYDRSEATAEIIVAAFNSFYNSKNIENADNLFSKIIDYCSTDISVVDFTEAKEEIHHLLPDSSKEKLKVFVSDNIGADLQEG